MSFDSGWHWFIAVFTVLNIIGCVWLIVWSSRQGDVAEAGDNTTGHVWDGVKESNNPLPRWWLYL
ncbi:MAG: cbb3-type cytochrome c oxidase N-terminal domain-containing protein, partial [Pseudomonadota bacterium]